MELYLWHVQGVQATTDGTFQSSGAKAKVVRNPCNDTTWQARSLRGLKHHQLDLHKT
jgi:hypothetical protein